MVPTMVDGSHSRCLHNDERTDVMKYSFLSGNDQFIKMSVCGILEDNSDKINIHGAAQTDFTCY